MTYEELFKLFPGLRVFADSCKSLLSESKLFSERTVNYRTSAELIKGRQDLKKRFEKIQSIDFARLNFAFDVLGHKSISYRLVDEFQKISREFAEYDSILEKKIKENKDVEEKNGGVENVLKKLKSKGLYFSPEEEEE